MSEPRRPLFLERANYRGRRLADAARILPVAGAFLFLLPILWAPAGGAPHGTTDDWLYLFGTWAMLILAAGLIAPRLMRGEDPPPADTTPEPQASTDEDG